MLGTSGTLLWKPITGFGYMAMGEGALAGEMLIATRGTSIVADWITDAQIAIQRGPSGLPVHAGFNETWKSIAPTIREFLRGRNPSRIHCVGHSLGGALATLNADYLTEARVADVALYTFGAPRAGGGIFAQALTQRMNQSGIYRVSNPVDPVPMIPLAPFWHLPFNQTGLVIQRTSDMPVSFSGHSMSKSYVPGVAGKDWSGLASDPISGSQVQAWLNQAAAGHGSFLMGSAKLLGMIASALGWLLKKAGQVLLGGISIGLTVSFTLLDQIAWLLSQSARASVEIGAQLKLLIGAIFRFLGRKTVEVADVSLSFLRWVLALLFNTLRSAAERALTTMGR
jgi:pimeloyl-ACP methyl ester carboxylesterase